MTVALLEVTVGMPMIPHSCILCANNPVDENTGQQQEAIFAPGVDVNFGDSVYICAACADIISDLRGRVTQSGFARLEEKHETLEKNYIALVEKYERAEGLLKRIRDGKKAVTEARGGKNSTKKAA